MDDISISSLTIGLVSGVVSSLLTYFTTHSKIRLDMTVKYDRALHDKRLELYKELWPKTAPLARFTPRFVLTYNIVKSVAEETREWYFREGGIYLSKRSRAPYFLLKEKLQQVMDDESRAARPDDHIGGKTCDAILEAASRLRTSLADDIRTRNALIGKNFRVQPQPKKNNVTGRIVIEKPVAPLRGRGELFPTAHSCLDSRF